MAGLITQGKVHTVIHYKHKQKVNITHTILITSQNKATTYFITSSCSSFNSCINKSRAQLYYECTLSIFSSYFTSYVLNLILFYFEIQCLVIAFESCPYAFLHFM